MLEHELTHMIMAYLPIKLSRIQIIGYLQASDLYQMILARQLWVSITTLPVFLLNLIRIQERDENKHFGYLLNYKFQSNEDCSSDEYLVMMVLFYLHLRTPRYMI